MNTRYIYTTISGYYEPDMCLVVVRATYVVHLLAVYIKI